MDNIAVIIPSCNPDESIISLLRKIVDLAPEIPIVVVNDGSKPECKTIFNTIEAMPQVTLLQHHVNLGKGRALKTAFNYYLNYFPDGIGVVTADGDGQHAPEDIIKCVERLRHSPEALILGVRDFSRKDVPLRSRVGNKITRTILKWAIGAPISDTQTGLRGIPRWFLKQILPLKGERFEFETSMLVAGKEAQIEFIEEKISTIYLNDNRGTHFDPLKDSVKVYKVIFEKTIRQMMLFFVSSICSAVIDWGLFALFCKVILPHTAMPVLLWSVIFARIISIGCNYSFNRYIVFAAKEYKPRRNNLVKYLLLSIIIMFASYAGTKAAATLFKADVVWLKAAVDVILFCLSFSIQKFVIFKPQR